MKKHRQPNRLIIAVLILLIALAVLPVASKAAPDNSPEGLVRRAWDLARNTGSYHFSTRVVQTTHLTPSLANVGRSSQVETLYLEGETDLPSDLIRMSLWQGEGHVLSPSEAVEVRVEGGHTYARQGDGPWQEMEDFTGSFAPGNDVSAFLVAAKNVQQLDNPGFKTRRYSFDLSGPVLAEYLRAQMEEQLRDVGKLPPGMHLSASDQYRNAVGVGEVWIDNDGLPLRLTVHLEYPQQRDGERVESDIYTDFFNFNRNIIAQSDGEKLHSSVNDLQTKAREPDTLLSLSFVGMLALALNNRQSKKIYAVIVIVVITSMVIAPLLQSVQAENFYQEQAVQKALYEDQQEEQAARMRLEQEQYSSDWDPHHDPLSEADEASSADLAPSENDLLWSSDSASYANDDITPGGNRNGSSDTTDSDGDGLTDSQEARLGTNPEEKDTDGDLITDDAEIAGFWYNNQWWYLDPLGMDSNNDSIPDGLECKDQIPNKDGERSPRNDDGSVPACLDSDEDGDPDVFDRDNDEDGIPDRMDLSPYSSMGLSGDFFSDENPLLLQVDNLTATEPAFVDFQLRPVNEDHLWYALNVLDWPSSDDRGQIQRRAGNNSTYADIGDEAPNASNGDMRLIPMLEIEMTGDIFPLEFTTPTHQTSFDTDFAGVVDINLAQQGTDIHLDFGIEMSGTYDIDFIAGDCKTNTTAKYAFSGVADGDPGTITGEKLTAVAEGTLLVRVSNGSEFTCGHLGNVVNGPYEDLMVDPEPLEPYGVSIKEKDYDGTLLAYLPLTMVEDETGGGRVAFAGHMHYRPNTNEWGDTQKVRMVWLVQMLVDQCKQKPQNIPPEEYPWCSQDDHWLMNQTQLVRVYEGEWYLTGLSVREDHGLDVGIVFEDPEEDADLIYDDWLWTLAWNLNETFMTGRDCYPMNGEGECKGDGVRDITMAEIRNRFHNKINGSTSDDDRWGIPITATQVITYAYEHMDYVSHIMMTETQKILDKHFTDYVDLGSDAPTLMFAQEMYYRMANLGDADNVTISSNQLTVDLDPEKSKMEVSTTLSWAPYRYEGDEWHSYPIDEYWDKIEVRFKEIFTEYKDDPEFEEIRGGQILVAQMAYMSLFQGLSAMVQTGDTLTGSLVVDKTDIELGDWASAIIAGGGGITRMTKAVALTVVDVWGIIQEGAKLRLIYSYVNHGSPSSVMQIQLADKNKLTKLTKEHLHNTILVVGIVILLGLYIVAEYVGSPVLNHILGAVNISINLYLVVGLVRTLVKAYKSVETTVVATLAQKTANFAKSLSSWAFVIGFVIALAVTWGMWGYSFANSGVSTRSLAFTASLAAPIAGTITALIMIAIALIPIVGQIIVAVIALIDSIVTFACALAGSDHPVCKGISGWLTEVIRWIIFSQIIMVDLGHEERLKVSDYEQKLINTEMGMIVGNSLEVSATVRNQIRFVDWSIKEGNVFGWLYRGLGQFSSNNLRSSNFRYHLDSVRRCYHEHLNRYGIRKYEWEPQSDSANSYVIYRDDTTEVPLVEAGINRGIRLYVNESYAVPAQECWLFVCYVRAYRNTNNINLGQSLKFDIFPATFNEFYDLAEKEGGYALSWSLDTSPSFPRLLDADGDGLRLRVAGGADPDDSTWDTDGDRLDDYQEIEIGSNPQDWDSDDDGLNDYEEVLRETNPNMADSDYDGLTDGEEVLGWEFVYDFTADGTPIKTWVTADPLSIDADLDGYTDFQEKTYGFHPGVFSDSNILTLSSDLDEPNAPRLLLRLDERENARTFTDDSGFNNNGRCNFSETEGGDECPIAGHQGKYGNAPYFDGENDYIHVQKVGETLTSGAISFGGWVYPKGGMTEDAALFAFHTAAGVDLNILAYDPATQKFYYSDGGSQANSTDTFPVNDWYHVMAVIEADNSGSLYVNGELEAIFTSSARPPADARFSLGQEWDGDTTSNFFLGYLDECLIFDYALTQADVVEAMSGIYNPSDFNVQSGDTIYYEATVKNELFNRYAQGLLSTDFPAAFEELPPTTFVLNPQDEVVLSGTVDIDATASGDYVLTQEADALITDWRDDSNYAEALYRFSDEDKLLDDSSGNHPPRDLSCSGDACPTLTVGYYANGAVFDGSNDRATTNSLAKYLTGPAISFGGWVYPDSSGSGVDTILSFGKLNHRLRLAYDHSSGKFTYDYKTSGTGTTYHIESANSFAPDQWYHVMITLYEGDSGNGYLYVNGIEERNFSSQTRPTSDCKFSLGVAWSGEVYYDHFKGRLDEIVLYPRALSYQEVQDQFNNPVFHLPFNEGSGAVEFEDTSGFENHAECQEKNSRCPDSGEEGINLNAVSFEGDDYITVPDSDVLDLTNSDFTISAWVFPEGNAPASSCPFLAEYFPQYPYSNQRRSRIERKCEDWPIDHDWGDGGWGSHPPDVYHSEDFEVHWTGTFFFETGTYTFTFVTDDGMRAWLDDAKILDEYHDQSETTYIRTRHIDEGLHTIHVEYYEWWGDAVAKVSWEPTPLPHPQGILGTNDYVTLERIGNRLQLVLDDTTSFLTSDDVLTPDTWNHVAASFDGNTWYLYVDGVNVDQFPVTGQTPAAGTGFDIGRVESTYQLDLETLSVLDINDDHKRGSPWGEIVIDLKLDDGGWQEIWSDTYMTLDDYPIDQQYAFEEEAFIKIRESDAGESCNYYTCPDDNADDLMGEHRLDALSVSPYESTTRFESDEADKADLLYTASSDSTPFQGKLDETAIYKKALSAEEIGNLYDAGTLALHLPLDDAPGSSDFIDATGQHNGACSGADCPTAGVPGREEMALLFDGVDDVVTISEVGTAEIENLTLSAWVRLNDLPAGDMRLITVGDDKAVLSYHDGDLRFKITTRGVPNNTEIVLDYTPGWGADTWYHIAATYDGTTMRIYIDGSEVANQATTGDQLVGGDNVSLSDVVETLDGYLDDVRLYRRVLSTGEIEALYTAVPELLLLLDEPEGSTQFEDSTGNAHHGTCSGNACPTAGAKGQIGLAADFDGVDDQITVNNAVPNGQQELTLALWVKPETLPDRVMRFMTLENEKAVLRYDGSPSGGTGQVHFYMTIDSSFHQIRVNQALQEGYWYHIAGTYDGETMRLYLNGFEIGSHDVTGTVENGSDLYLSSSSEALHGLLDHATVYVRALSGYEIRDLFRLQAKWVEDRQSTVITVDNEPPTSTLKSRVDYLPLADTMLLVGAGDTHTYVSMVEMGVSNDGGGSYTWESVPACGDSAVAWCALFDPTVEGTYQLVFRATDSVGNRETPSEVFVIHVDNQAPETVNGTLRDTSQGEVLQPVLDPIADALWYVSLEGTVIDPDIGGIPGSGVAEVVLQLFPTVPVTDSLPLVVADLDGGTWGTDYPIFAADPTGTYTVALILTDKTGNKTELFDHITVDVDAAPPVANLDEVPTNITATITSTLQLSGSITETEDVNIGIAGMEVSIIPAAMEDLSGTVAILHLDEPAGAISFTNMTGIGDAGCSGNACPTAGESGVWGTALSFDGNDYLSADLLSGAVTDTLGFSFGAWVYPNGSVDSAILAFNSASGDDRNQLLFDGDNKRIVYADGSTTATSEHGVWQNWAHIMVSIDHQGNGVLYMNGVAEATFTTAVHPDSDGRFSIGQEWDSSTPSDHFDGVIDEVVVYNRALSPAEVYTHYASATLANSGQGVLQTTWAYTLPNTLDGIYQINIRPEDMFANRAPEDQWAWWRGEIDTRDPVVDIQIVEETKEIDGGAGSPFGLSTTYTCWARDFNLIHTSGTSPQLDFQCPCQQVAPTSTVISDTYYHEVSPWYAETFTDTARLYEHRETCTVFGVQTIPNYMKACDIYGHCTEAQDQDVEEISSDIPDTFTLIFTPTHKTIFTTTSAISIEGKAYALDFIDTVVVKSGGTMIGTPVDLTCPSSVTETQWAQHWDPGADGVYSIHSEATSCTSGSWTEEAREITFDTISPTLTLAPTAINRDQRLSYGRVVLAGAVSDATSGVAKVEVSVDGGGWADASFVEADNRWRWDWYLGREPDNEQHTVSVRATDRAGWTTRITETATVDLDVPNPVTLTLTSNVTAGGVVSPGLTLRSPAATFNLNWQASEPPAKLSHYDIDWKIRTATQTVVITDTVAPVFGIWPPLTSIHVGLEGQRIEPAVTSVFTDGNTQWDDWGPVYVDSQVTPDYINIDPHNQEIEAYHGWMESGCTALGVDRRIMENAQYGQSLDTAQKLYVSWDTAALRIAWVGANWDYDGDLFIYMDTLGDLSVPTTAFNPFAGDLTTLNIPGSKAFIWVEDSQMATLYYWNGTSFDQDILSETEYRYDAGLYGGITDLYIPFNKLGITSPATTPLVLYAFATDEGEMSLWATMPIQNPVSSARVVKTALYAGDAPVLDWFHFYAWPSLGPGICPNNPTGLLQIYNDADLRFDLDVSPEGTAYGLHSSDLFWLADELTNLTRTVDLSYDFDFMDVEHYPVGHGDTVTYTISYANRGTYTATGVIVRAAGLYALELTGEVNDIITKTIGNIPPGATGSISFTGQIDASGPDNDWAVMGAVVHDTIHGPIGFPIEWLWADHEVDTDPPEFLGILSPEYFIGADTTPFSGYAYDVSGVPLITLDASPPSGPDYETDCPDDSPKDGAWACLWDAGGASEGDQFELRLQATDHYGNVSDWTDWRTFIVDNTPPTLTLSAETQALSSTIVGENIVQFTGSADDNHGIGEVEVCVDGTCEPANTQMNGVSTYEYENGSAGAIGACGVSPLVRTFVVTESFTLGSVSLGFNADHPMRDELQVTLAKGGTTVTVIAPPEGTATEYANFDVFLDDVSVAGLHESRADDDTGLPYYDRDTRPYAPLADFLEMNANGTWTLTICDLNAGDHDGNFNRAKLVLRKQNPGITSADWFSLLIDLENQDHISHTMEAYVFDLAGNRSEVVSLTFVVDNVAPELVLDENIRLFATGPTPEAIRVLGGSTTDGDIVQDLYALVLSPSGNRQSLNLGRDGDDWWLDLTPEEVGDYTVWVNAVDPAGNAVSLGPFTVTIVRVTAENDGSTALGETTNFTATVSGDDSSGYTFRWDYGDDSPPGAGGTTSHEYQAIGLYTATLTATKGTQVFTAITSVVVDEIITDLTAENDSLTPYGEATTLTSTITTGSNVTYQWDFGDNLYSATDDQAVAYHSYQDGIYTATVTAINSVSAMTTTTQVLVTELGLVNDSPTEVDASTTFTATLSFGQASSYLWDFGDGSRIRHKESRTAISSEPEVVSHTYKALGIYTTTLVANTENGSISAKTTVTITEATIRGLNLSNDSPTALGQPTNLTATLSTGSNVTYQWDFGDNSPVTSSASPITSHTYPLGEFTALVTATNSVNSMTATSLVIIDNTPPTSSIADPNDGQTITEVVYQIHGTAADDYGVDRVEVSTDDGITWHNATGSTTWSYNWTVPWEKGITHTILSRAIDLAGNMETPGPGVTVMVNNLLPGPPIFLPIIYRE